MSSRSLRRRFGSDSRSRRSRSSSPYPLRRSPSGDEDEEGNVESRRRTRSGRDGGGMRRRSEMRDENESDRQEPDGVVHLRSLPPSCRSSRSLHSLTSLVPTLGVCRLASLPSSFGSASRSSGRSLVGRSEVSRPPHDRRGSTGASRFAHRSLRPFATHVLTLPPPHSRRATPLRFASPLSPLTVLRPKRTAGTGRGEGTRHSLTFCSPRAVSRPFAGSFATHDPRPQPPTLPHPMHPVPTSPSPHLPHPSSPLPSVVSRK